jgi:hypothetical protein
VANLRSIAYEMMSEFFILSEVNTYR